MKGLAGLKASVKRQKSILSQLETKKEQAITTVNHAPLLQRYFRDNISIAERLLEKHQRVKDALLDIKQRQENNTILEKSLKTEKEKLLKTKKEAKNAQKVLRDAEKARKVLRKHERILKQLDRKHKLLKPYLTTLARKKSTVRKLDKTIKELRLREKNARKHIAHGTIIQEHIRYNESLVKDIRTRQLDVKDMLQRVHDHRATTTTAQRELVKLHTSLLHDYAKHQQSIRLSQEEQERLQELRKNSENVIAEARDAQHLIDTKNAVYDHVLKAEERLARQQSVFRQEMSTQQQDLHVQKAEAQQLISQAKQSHGKTLKLKKAFGVMKDQEEVLRDERSQLHEELSRLHTEKKGMVEIEEREKIEKRTQELFKRENEISYRETSMKKHEEALSQARKEIESAKEDLLSIKEAVGDQVEVFSDQYRHHISFVSGIKKKTSAMLAQVKNIIATDISHLHAKEKEVQKDIAKSEKGKIRIQKDEEALMKTVKRFDYEKKLLDSHKHYYEKREKELLQQEEHINELLEKVQEEKKELVYLKKLKGSVNTLRSQHKKLQEQIVKDKGRLFVASVDPAVEHQALKEKARALHLLEQEVERQVHKAPGKNKYIREEIDNVRTLIERHDIDAAVVKLSKIEVMLDKIKKADDKRMLNYEVKILRNTIKLAELEA